MFKIIPDRRRKLMKVETSGLGTVEEVTLFYRDLHALLRELRWGPGEYVTLMHTLDEVVQTQAVMQAFSAGLQSFPVPSRKVAVVKTGALAGLQSRRVLTSDRSALFATVSEAESWLAT